MKRRLWIGWRFPCPSWSSTWAGTFSACTTCCRMAGSNWILLVLATPVVLWAGWPFFVRGWQSLITRNLNMFTLIALGTGTAWVYSVVATVAPRLFPPRSCRTAPSRSISSRPPSSSAWCCSARCWSCAPASRPAAPSGRCWASRRRTALEGRRRRQREEVPIEAIVVGDRLRVRPGEKVPVDGVVIEGRSAVDESTRSPASPCRSTKEAGAKVIGGTVNRTGTFVMKAEKVGADTMLARIVKMVAEAQRSRAPIQRLADSVSSWFVPAGGGGRARWPSLPGSSGGREPRVRLRPAGRRLRADHRLPLRAGAGHADVDHGRRRPWRRSRRPDPQRRGAGAAGEGRHAGGRQDRHPDRRAPGVIADRALGALAEAEVLRLAASLERGSEHPIATAILAAARERKARAGARRRLRFAVRQGRGRHASTGKRLLLGNAAFLKERASTSPRLDAKADALRGDGATVDAAGRRRPRRGRFSPSAIRSRRRHRRR